MSSQGDLHMFSHATNPVILGGTFTNVANPTESKVNGFKLLLDHISQGAFHNAAERGDPPRCHPRTRLAIRAEIMEWIKAPRPMRKLILWMYGPAGSGKTAIAQSIAEECDQLGLLAASFFFWRSAPGRNDASRFVATLAYQLSRYIPQMERHLVAAIEGDPTILFRSLATQIRVLVIEPLKLAAPSPSMPIAAIVDGVDECGPDGRAQSDLLHQLGTIASELQHLPLIFLVASRPEYQIREAFNGNQLNPLVRVLVLDNKYKPDEDIKLYFDSTFHKICKKNLQLGFRLPSGWPPANDVNTLVSKASGQFIFASTVTKFVDSLRHNPVERLNIVLRLTSTGNETPFAPLDALYRFIMGSVSDNEKVLDILTLLLLAGNYENRLSLADAEELLGFDIRRALVDMHALLFVPPLTDDKLPQSYHASLFDFLRDRSRSLEYYIYENQDMHAKFARRWFKVIKFRDQSRISTYAAIPAFVHHFSQLDSNSNQDLLDDLARFDLRTFLECISDFDLDLYVSSWKDFMECVKKQGGHRADVFPRLQSHFDAFILNRISQYPAQLQPHVSTLLSGPAGNGTRDMFNIVLAGVSQSAEELNELRRLDRRLLSMASSRWVKEATYIRDLLEDAARAETYFVHPRRYLILLKAVVTVICARPGEKNYGIVIERATNRDRYNATMRIGLLNGDFLWFERILKKAPIDFDLANFLRERAVQFKNDMEPLVGRWIIAKASIRYMQRCRVPFRIHVHQSHIDVCIICSEWSSALIVEGMSITSNYLRA